MATGGGFKRWTRTRTPTGSASARCARTGAATVSRATTDESRVCWTRGYIVAAIRVSADVASAVPRSSGQVNAPTVLNAGTGNVGPAPTPRTPHPGTRGAFGPSGRGQW
jgi:hypothetical protein